MNDKGCIGLIAGNGDFPLEFANSANNMGYRVFAVAHEGETRAELQDMVEEISWVKIGQFKKLIKQFEKWKVKKIAMLGGIKRPRIFHNVHPDLLAFKVMARAKSLKDDIILRAIGAELESRGFKLISPAEILQECVGHAGTITSQGPEEGDQRTIRVGIEAAKTLGALDVGQTVVVKDGVVVALEAAEGTDATILRGGELAGAGSIVVKMAKPQQDLRMDLPAIGPATVEGLSSIAARGLVLEAGKCLILNPLEVVAKANAAGIFITILDNEAFLKS